MRLFCCPLESCVALHIPPGAPDTYQRAMSVDWGCFGCCGVGQDPRLVGDGHLFVAGSTHTVQLQLLSMETGVRFAGVDFVFYNCSALQS